MTTQGNERRLLRRFYRPAHQRPFWGLVVLLMGMGVGRVLLTPAVDSRVRSFLQSLPNAHGTYRDLSIFSFPPVVVVKDLIVDDAGGNRVVAIPRLEVHLAWSDVRRGLWQGQWPSPAPKMRVRAVNPTLYVRSNEAANIGDEISTLSMGLPPAVIDVAALEGASVVARPRNGIGEWACARGITRSAQFLVIGRLPTEEVQSLCERARKTRDGVAGTELPIQPPPTSSDTVVFAPLAVAGGAGATTDE